MKTKPYIKNRIPLGWDNSIEASELLKSLETYLKEDPNAVVNVITDYGGCYYEGDRPDVYLEIKWLPPKV